MANEMFASLSFDELTRQLRQGRVEPEFDPRSAPRTADPTAISDTPRPAEMSGISDVQSEARAFDFVPGEPPPTSALGRRTLAAGSKTGILLYLVLVGLVATATIGVFFGIGFFLLAQPKEKMIAGSGNHDRGAEMAPLRSGAFLPPHSDAPAADRQAAAVSREPGTPRSATAAALPVGFPLAQRPAVDQAAAQESKVMRGSVSVSPGGDASASGAKGATPTGEVPAPRSTAGEATVAAPAQAPSAAEPAPSSVALLAPPPQASPSPVAAANTGPPEDAAHRAIRGGRSGAHVAAHHARSARHHGKLAREERAALAEKQRILSAASDRAHRENFSDSVQPLTPPPAGQRNPFDRLLTPLTGQTKPFAQSLTPPQDGQADPFAQRARNK